MRSSGMNYSFLVRRLASRSTQQRRSFDGGAAGAKARAPPAPRSFKETVFDDLIKQWLRPLPVFGSLVVLSFIFNNSKRKEKKSEAHMKESSKEGEEYGGLFSYLLGLKLKGGSKQESRHFISFVSLGERILSYKTYAEQISVPPKSASSPAPPPASASASASASAPASASSAQPKPVVYVLKFKGDIQASQVKDLREEITAILEIAVPGKGDELLYNGEGAAPSSSSGDDGSQTPVRRRLLLRRPAPEVGAPPLPPPTQSPSAPFPTSPAAQYELELEQLKREDERADQQQQQQQQQHGKKQPRSASQPLTLPQLKALWSSRLPRCRILPVSAITSSPEQNNIPPLVSLLVSLCPRGPKYFHADTLTNRDERFFTTEIIRESLLACYQDEVPYSCEVVIESFKDEGNGGLSRISAIIVVAQNSHKAILIGKQGSKLKEVGTMARLKLEKFLGRRVFLALHVKVDEDWRSNQEALERYGYMQTADSDFG